MEIRKLVQDGVAIAKIAQALGRDWKTIAKAAKAEHIPKYTRKPRESILDPYKAFIQAKLAEAPYTARRILELLRLQGFTGQIRMVQEFCGTVKEEERQKAVIRFETLPGRQMQVDWAEFAWVDFPDGSRRKLYGFGAILGFSRMRFLVFTFDQRVQTLLDCLILAFEYFGGVPEEILFDNMKTVVLNRDIREGTVAFHPKTKDFAGYYGFKLRLAWPYRAQTKGKIERTLGYAKQDFWPGIRFANLPELNAQALAWCEKVNGRPHSQTHEIPRERLLREPLSRIAGRPRYDTRKHEVRRASKECFVSFEGNLYSVPWKLAGRDITVLAGREIVTFFFNGEKIAEHARTDRKGQRLSDPRHFEGLLAHSMKRARREAIKRLPVIALDGPPEGTWPVVEVRGLEAYDAIISETEVMG